jgi:hypothetical protein
MKQSRFRHELVDSIPEKLQANTLYVTKDMDVAGHLCACGCGREVITPLSPTDWSITFDQRGASLSPSVGNWAFPCRSHYFILHGSVAWARDMSDKSIKHGRQRAKARKLSYYEQIGELPVPQEQLLEELPPPTRQSVRQMLLAWWKQLSVW